MVENIENIKDKLKEHGYKLTFQRKVILEAFEQDERTHLSSEEIYDYIRKNYPKIGLATIYRTLQLYEELGVIYKQNFDDGFSKYEINYDKEGHQHHHLICSDCGAVEEFNQDLLDELEAKIEKEKNFKIKNHSVQFFGYCKKCKKD